LNNIDIKIIETKKKLDDIKKRWPLHSPKPSMFKELEDLELELEELKKLETTEK